MRHQTWTVAFQGLICSTSVTGTWDFTLQTRSPLALLLLWMPPTPDGGLSEAAHILLHLTGHEMLIYEKQLLTTSPLSAPEMKVHIEALLSDLLPTIP